MKKLIVCISLLLTIAMTVVACNNDTQNDAQTSDDVSTNATETTAEDNSSPEETTDGDTETVDESTTSSSELPTAAPTDEVTTVNEEPSTEPEPVKPSEPELPNGCIFYVGPEELAQRVADGKANNTTAEVKDGYVTLTSTGDDPYVYLMDNGANLELSWYFLLIVRLPSSPADTKYSVFAGNAPAPSADKVYNLTYGDECIGKWSCLPIGIQPLVGDNLTIGNLRYDYYNTNGGSIDVVGAYFFADDNSWGAFANAQNYILNN